MDWFGNWELICITENSKIIIIGLEKQCFSTRLVFREEEKKKNGAEESRSREEKEERRTWETKREEEHFRKTKKCEEQRRKSKKNFKQTHRKTMKNKGQQRKRKENEEKRRKTWQKRRTIKTHKEQWRKLKITKSLSLIRKSRVSQQSRRREEKSSNEEEMRVETKIPIRMKKKKRRIKNQLKKLEALRKKRKGNKVHPLGEWFVFFSFKFKKLF